MFYSSFIIRFIDLICAVAMLFAPSGFAVTPSVPRAGGSDARVMSFNLRCIGSGKTSVDYRAPLVIAKLNEEGADSIGFQEANIKWLRYLEKGLTNYAYVGRTRFDGSVLGEASPVFYRKDKYDLLDSGTEWLSKTPDKVGSKDWGSANIRVCTWAVLKNRETGKTYVHINTHLDHISSEARVHQMEIVLKRSEKYTGQYPVIITGDFNDTCESEMYQLATESFADCSIAAPVSEIKTTYHNYGKEDKTIDFIFISDKVTPLVYWVMDEKENGEYTSDHYGIYADIAF